MAIRKRTKDNIVVESNSIARAQLTPTATSIWEERIIAQVTAYNRKNDIEFPDTAFMVGQLVNSHKKISTRQLRDIDKASVNLIQTYFTVRYSPDSYYRYAVFSYIAFDSGIIMAKLNPDLKPYYLELKKQFAIRSLPEFRELTSVYSQQIFRHINSWGGMADTTVPIEELHHLTNAPPSLRKNFANFKARVLEPAHKEINAKTSLKFDWEAIKPGRRVVEIRFIFKSKTL